ncbi:hypothetical protein AMECASPLE_026419 [Ameca splendens]|uniref:Secreted protein n=1 Tax=Ameca splendens TaxID=208324 RepID=A0ABV0Y5I1_9TELE
MIIKKLFKGGLLAAHMLRLSARMNTNEAAAPLNHVSGTILVRHLGSFPPPPPLLPFHLLSISSARPPPPPPSSSCALVFTRASHLPLPPPPDFPSSFRH